MSNKNNHLIDMKTIMNTYDGYLRVECDKIDFKRKNKLGYYSFKIPSRYRLIKLRKTK